MRMWNVDPEVMCRQHLLGEHLEMHMFLGCLKKGRKIEGYIEKGQVEVENIIKRHDVLAGEMKARGYNHNDIDLSEYQQYLYKAGYVSKFSNTMTLEVRCPECSKRIIKRYASKDPKTILRNFNSLIRS